MPYGRPIEEHKQFLEIAVKNGLYHLHNAVVNENAQEVKKLLDDPKLDINEKDRFGNTALGYAILTGNCEIVSLLLDEKNKKICLNEKLYEFPLFIAVAIVPNPKFDIVDLLVQHGADINASYGQKHILDIVVEKYETATSTQTEQRLEMMKILTLLLSDENLQSTKKNDDQKMANLKNQIKEEMSVNFMPGEVRLPPAGEQIPSKGPS